MLARLSFTAQLLLLPRSDKVQHANKWEPDTEFDIRAAIETVRPETVWRQYYMVGSSDRSHDAASPDVILGSDGKVVTNKEHWAPSNVRSFFRPSDGVWHPDRLVPRLFWAGGGREIDARGGFYNPFAHVPNDVLVQTCTEKLSDGDEARASPSQTRRPAHPKAAHAPARYASPYTQHVCTVCSACSQVMQWAIEQHGRESAEDRGNWPEAAQDASPDWLVGKRQHLAFTALRAYPIQQMRKLCVALRQQSLPLDQPAVHTLLKQTFYHLGDVDIDSSRIDDGGALVDGVFQSMGWRADLVEHGGWSTLRGELESLAEQLLNKTREHSALLILGELAAVASQWDAPSRTTARKFARTSRKWADDLTAEIESHTTDAATLRARQCIFYMYAMVCNCAGELQLVDVEALCQGAILAEYNRIFDEPTPHDNAVRALTTVAADVMARRLPDVILALQETPDRLTAAVKLVLGEKTPAQLTWTRVTIDGTETSCFEALACIEGNTTLITLNPQSGVLLFDGMPPSRLPSTMLLKPLYQRTFADRNFEVRVSSGGALTTLRRVHDRFYSFYLDSAGKLVVHENDPDGKAELELLDGTPDGVTCWGGDLPVRLREMHSHWICRAAGTVMLRPKLFNESGVHFLLNDARQQAADRTPGETPVPTGDWTCHRVPHHQKSMHWHDLNDLGARNTFDELVQAGDSPVHKVLSKFEDPSFVHTLITPIGSSGGGGGLVFELPRYEITFEMTDQGTLRSMNFLGYSLAPDQLLRDTLHGFEQYLVVESARYSSKSLKLLLPAGLVQKEPHRIGIAGDSACDAPRLLHVFDAHARFSNLEVAAGPLAIEARLQLAAVYAATDLELLQPRSNATGGEIAMDLVRQCRVNRPLTENEHSHLVRLAGYGSLTPALPLLCFDLEAGARQLAFLHPGAPLLPELRFDHDAANEYTQREQRDCLSTRSMMSPDEKTRVLSQNFRARWRGATIPAQIRTLGVPALEGLIRTRSCARRIESLNDQLRKMLVHTPAPEGSANTVPINLATFKGTELGRYLAKSLAMSWKYYQSLSTVRLRTDDLTALETELRSMHGLVHQEREELEAQILRSISHVVEGASFSMRRAANLDSWATSRDLARAALDSQLLLCFNPRLSPVALEQIHEAIIVWLQLCVLEDKLVRMADHAGQQSSQELQRELLNVGREWSAPAHPEWLVYEVEQQLQIRRVQYIIAQFLVDHPCAITQLNMGEGKTRVVIPMLLLCLAQPNTLMRLNFLSPLLGEAFHFLHRHITASLMSRPIYLMPFNRDVKLDRDRVQMMRQSLLQCQASLGAVCVAPEHRLSLKLKSDELRLEGTKAASSVLQLLQALDEIPAIDILDESDELLRHKYQVS